ncbi:MAG: Ig-like domain-containing protein, partial [bacterium]
MVVKNAAGTTVASGTADETGHFTANVTGLGQGVNTLTATATDAAGNLSNVSSGLIINVDTVDPTTPVISTVAGNDVINIVERDATGGVVISGTTEAGSSVKVNGQAATVSGTTWTTSLTASQVDAFGQGSETLTVVATDAAGNTSTQTKAINVDTVAPLLVPQSTLAGDDVINIGERDAGVRLSGMVEVGSTLTVNGVAATVQPQGSATAKVW